ncbi:MAG TPA: response regulator [Terriglobia bacterium]
MADILIASVVSRMASELSRRLAGVCARTPDSTDLAQELAESPADLTILDDGFAAPHTLDLLVELRQFFPNLPVIYCLDPDAGGKLVQRLLLELKVNELLFHPISCDTLAQRVASLLGLPWAPDDSATAGHQAVIKGRLAEVWNRARSRMIERLDVLDQAGVALLEGRLGSELRKQAESDAHKLAGSLGIFELAAGTRFAQEIERSLRCDSLRSEAQARRFSELAAALRLEIERSPAVQAPWGQASSDPGPRPALLVGCDSELVARLCEEAAARGWRWEAAPDMSAARTVLSSLNPSAVLVDIDSVASTGEPVAVLSELSEGLPPLPTLILTSGGNLMDRVEVARSGGLGFFPKTLPPGEIVEAALGLLDRLQSARSQVLAVDDDPVVLEALAALLDPSGIRLTGLSDPLRFWEALEGSPPDLLVLDIEMPSLSGIELCRVVRNDPRWASIPVIFLTGVTESGTVHQVFASGADDFVAKPIVGPELVTRITNRLERTRLLRNVVEVDTLSGLPNRLKSRRAFADFLDLADRHGQPMGLAVLGVDGLGRINEVYGQATGDEVLRQLGRCLRRAFRSEEVVARWAGNDFRVGMYGLDRPGSIRRLEGVFRTLAEQTFVGSGMEEFHATLSGGVAGYPDDASDLDGLLRAADDARRRANAGGVNQLLAASFSSDDPDGPRLIDLAVATGDKATASVLLHAFESEGFRARALRNGVAAARMLAGADTRLRARVLVIDLDLPGLDGLTLLRQLAVDGVLDDTRAIVISPASVGKEAALALELGAGDLIAKPFDVPVLVKLVRQALDSPRLPGRSHTTGQRHPVTSDVTAVRERP